MNLYRGLWPQVIPKLAKYAVRIVDREWKVTVLYDAGNDLRYLAVDGGASDLAERVNKAKIDLTNQQGGTFYINEYQHLIVPIAKGNTSEYYFAGHYDKELIFEYNDAPLTTKPIRADGQSLKPGEKWIGPRPGIPYVLAAGAKDIYYETPALTNDNPPTIMPMTTRRVRLSKVLNDAASAQRAAEPVARWRGHQGGKFYVNEHGSMFTPVSADDGNGLDYLYCGQIEMANWFPEPPTE